MTEGPRVTPMRPARSQPSRPSQPRRAPSAEKGRKDYATPVMGLFQIPMAGFAIAGQRNPRMLADARAMEFHCPRIAKEVDALANARPEVAAALERIMQVGPYGALIGATAPLILQILANHEVIPPGALGTTRLVLESSPDSQPDNGKVSGADVSPN